MNIAQHVVAGGFAVTVVINCTCCDVAAQDNLNVERLQQLLQRYPEADTDKDGKLTAEEARSYLRKMRSAKTNDAPASAAADAKKPAGEAPSAADDAAQKARPRDKAGKEKTYAT